MSPGAASGTKTTVSFTFPNAFPSAAMSLITTLSSNGLCLLERPTNIFSGLRAQRYVKHLTFAKIFVSLQALSA
jgi:hypothetical protein